MAIQGRSRSSTLKSVENDYNRPASSEDIESKSTKNGIFRPPPCSPLLFLCSLAKEAPQMYAHFRPT